jgi:hypothetical protein
LSIPVLDLPIARALAEHTTHLSLRASASAWLAAYELAHQLGFSERVAVLQANAAWDRAAATWRLPLDEEPRYELTEAGRRASP